MGTATLLSISLTRYRNFYQKPRSNNEIRRAVYYKREDLQEWLDRLNNKKSGILSECFPGKSGSSGRLMAEKEGTIIEK